MRPWRQRRRPLPRSLAEAVVLLVLLALVLAGARLSGWLAPETGRFTAIDGDSLRKDEQEYRLHAIDAPELNQTCRNASGREYPCGREAREALRRLVAGTPLACRILDTDRYGRLVAECTADGLSINREMVRLGWALAYRRHGLEHVAAEEEARAAGRGLWQGRFQTPQDWRRQHGRVPVRGSLAEGEDGAD